MMTGYTYPFFLSLEKMYSSRTLDARQKPHWMCQQQTFHQTQITGWRIIRTTRSFTRCFTLGQNATIWTGDKRCTGLQREKKKIYVKKWSAKGSLPAMVKFIISHFLVSCFIRLFCRFKQNRLKQLLTWKTNLFKTWFSLPNFGKEFNFNKVAFFQYARI